ncbi:MAG TPA: divalent-cation tolerance protein CutA, partial [Anaeromyxobacteraceae bacterium]|nr:divalent-cation tolerance protein CutA [Anaeromyxobacteraceae bacterium]
MTDTLVVLVTAPSPDEAARIARVLVEEKLAACGNVLPGVRSIYRWQGKLCDEQEALLVLKAPRKQ